MSSDMDSEPMNNIAVSNHKFMAHLYEVLAAKEENFFFSPVSIYIALVLVYLGSKEKTAEELQKCLFLPEEKEHLLEGLPKLLNELKHPELTTATEMFVEQTYQLRKSFEEDAKKFINSDSQLVDYKTAAHATELINSWVSSQTNNRINDLIPAGILDEQTRLVLVNAIHFKDVWMKPFKSEDTYKQNFFTSRDNFKEVDMMHLTGDFYHKEEDTFKILELPYKSGNFEMLIFLPKEIDGLAGLEKRLPELSIKDILRSTDRIQVNVSLPKFKLENFFNLNEVLQKIGLNKMFDPKEADLTGIYEPTEDPLFISNVLHKAFIEVDEEGTEAAAATGCHIRSKRCIIVSEDFVADHPFLYFITSNHNVLFVGRMNVVF